MCTYVRIKYIKLTFIKTIRGMAGDKHFFQNELLLKVIHLVSKYILFILVLYIH